jgi:integrase
MSQVIPLQKTPKIKLFPKPSNRKKGVQYKQVRPREWLTASEVKAMMSAVKKHNRNGLRDATMILMAYVHGLRATELLKLTWAQLDFSSRNPCINVLRLKKSKDGTHPLIGDETEALRKLDRMRRDSPYVFVTSSGNRMTIQAFWKIIKRAGEKVGMPFPVHPHMLRHACGHRLVNSGRDTRSMQDWLGHKNIRHTEHYSELAPDRFRGFWPE